ncbi:hypothetical protein HHI36_000005 [Cryptolaemus montrouzieri]|uniref:Uncharacterized protein n=1 Tax=Cryptolaemus montrouzieri TaxID=559131 RepID=A0ABD2P428_9CUCU
MYFLLSKIDNNSSNCSTRTSGGIDCNGGLICSYILNNRTGEITRGCDDPSICDNVRTNETCGTCSTDLCIPDKFNFGFRNKAFLAPIVAGLIFAFFSR